MHIDSWSHVVYDEYTLSNFEIRCDVILGRLRASLRVSIKRPSFVSIPYTTHMFYGNSPQICNDITSNLEVGQSVGMDWSLYFRNQWSLIAQWSDQPNSEADWKVENYTSENQNCMQYMNNTMIHSHNAGLPNLVIFVCHVVSWSSSRNWIVP